MIRHNPHNGGFSLIETLVYLGLYALIMSGAIISVYTIFESAGRNQTKAMVQEEGTFLAGKIDWVLSGVATTTVPNLGATSSALSVVKFDGTVVTLTLTDLGVLQLKDGANPLLPLNNSNTHVSTSTESSGLVFANTGSSTDPTIPVGVTATFRVSSRTPSGALFMQDFSTTKYLRR